LPSIYHLMGWKGIAVVSFIGTVGLALLFIGCALDSSWWPMTELIVYAVLPIPLLLCAGVEEDGYGRFKAMADFLVGALLVTLFAIPLVMYHVNRIDGAALAFSLVSPFVILCAGAVGGIIKTNADAGGACADWA